MLLYSALSCNAGVCCAARRRNVSSPVGVCINGRLHRTPKGVPQGGPLSPVLSNVLLDELDRELETRQHRFVRYADDVVIFVKSVRAGNRV